MTNHPNRSKGPRMGMAKYFKGPYGIAKTERVEVGGKVLREEEFFRDNDGSLIIMAGQRGTDNYERIGCVNLTFKAKRGEAYKTADPVAEAHAHLFAASEALLAAAESLLDAIAHIPGIEPHRAAMMAACVKAHGGTK